MKALQEVPHRAPTRCNGRVAARNRDDIKHKRMKIAEEALRAFTYRVFKSIGCPDGDAALATDVLVTADLRGVDSHGVARLRSEAHTSELQSLMRISYAVLCLK